MTNATTPYSAFVDLGSLSAGGLEQTLTPNAPERSAIAAWLGTEAMESFTANLRITRKSDDHYLYTGRFDARIVQACVVTLEPVSSDISGEFRRSLHVRSRAKSRRRKLPEEPPVPVDISTLDDDEQEWLDSPHFDLAGPLLEELSLALDPYPRAPGVAFAGPEEPEEPVESPFAVLENLKKSQSGKKGG